VKLRLQARSHWLTPVIQLLRRQRSGGSQFDVSLGKQFMRPYLENTHHKKKGWQSGSSGKAAV
jgi:hypothetical protein